MYVCNLNLIPRIQMLNPSLFLIVRSRASLWFNFPLHLDCMSVQIYMGDQYIYYKNTGFGNFIGQFKVVLIHDFWPRFICDVDLTFQNYRKIFKSGKRKKARQNFSCNLGRFTVFNFFEDKKSCVQKLEFEVPNLNIESKINTMAIAMS